MWTARIFFAIVFSGIGFMLWFLFGLFREERAHSLRHARIVSPAPSPPRSYAIPKTCAITRRSAAGWSSLVARRAHNPKVAGSNPAPAI